MPKIVIYTKTGCPYCRTTMDDYRQRKVSFEEINLSLDSEAKAMVKSRYQATKVPLIVDDGNLVQIGDKNGNG
ncbi:MAG: glutaredoxin family protein [Eubacteriales bacterium]|nr:glutaredoxin family protein [Bacillota bacterium]MBV1726684.1 glutaredoxin family protein [Desulforudis sp.]MDQ7789704.1 glutaredoxin family protein [Clostridia bacterium]MDZ4042731.1 glutaredoxin family protein [Eubacteriales bacterium]MBU4533007.1 glutaredoxin family protein [Bacillota bacterium]